MTYRISKSFTFSASHQLFGLPEGHQCGRLHGHNYTVWLELTGDELPRDGMLLDFGRMGRFKEYIDTFMDHRHLNEMLDQPTAEHLAAHLHEVATSMLTVQVGRVVVWETATCWASYGG